MLKTIKGQNRLELLILLSCEKIFLNLKEALDRTGKSSELLERGILFKLIYII